MAICREFYFPSSDGSSRIHAAEWTPESGEIIGVLQIAHGVAEYGMRYAPFAEFMTEHGFAVVANDHLGHGLSAEKDADTLYFGPRDGWKHVVDDMYALRCRTKEKYPDVPYFLMGHSMGSFLTRTYLIRYPGTVDAAIIMGTGHQSPAIVAGGRAIAKRRGQAPRLQGALSARGGAGFRCLQQGVRAQPHGGRLAQRERQQC
ncbi:MAG: alpha/beta hydrolase [Oscillibacter sp.]